MGSKTLLEDERPWKDLNSLTIWPQTVYPKSREYVYVRNGSIGWTKLERRHYTILGHLRSHTEKKPVIWQRQDIEEHGAQHRILTETRVKPISQLEICFGNSSGVPIHASVNMKTEGMIGEEKHKREGSPRFHCITYEYSIGQRSNRNQLNYVWAVCLPRTDGFRLKMSSEDSVLVMYFLYLQYKYIVTTVPLIKHFSVQPLSHFDLFPGNLSTQWWMQQS